MANGNKHAVYEFDEFRLDASKLMLYREGREIVLPPKVVETLLALIENQGEIVGKDDLMNRIWANTAVEESNLSQYLYLLRKTLGETKGGVPFIETLRRRGYRFNGTARLVENHQPTNGAASVKASETPRFGVERQGNVLKLTAWNRAEKPEAENLAPTGAAENNFRAKRFSNGSRAIIGIVAALAVALSFLWLNRTRNAVITTTERRGEMTIVRLTNGNVPHGATISPDGNYFVYHETDGALSRVWLQQTGTSNRVEIVPPTEKTISGKTFSPDGAFVFFLAKGKGDALFSLYRVSTLGGVLTKILSDINSSPSFSPDGREMVFNRWNPQTGESALVIAASDGSAERILLSRTSNQEVLVNPAWSPDGGTVAFMSSYSQDSAVWSFIKINKIDLQTGEILALSPENWSGGCGRMIWTRDGAGVVFIGTKDDEGLTTRRDQVFYLSAATGEARRLTFDGNRHDIASLGVSADDAILVVPFNRSSQIWRMSADGDSRTAMQITNGQADGRAGLAPLADGRIAYITRTGETLSVWLMNGDGTNQKQLTSEPQFIEELRTPPGGSFFIFAAQQNRRTRLYRVEADGSNLRQLTFGDGNQTDSTVSPDGNWIVYDSHVFDNSSSKHELWKMPSAGGEAVLLTEKECATPHFSPDGKLISCISDDQKILVVSASNGAILKTFATVNIPALNVGARWTADGANLVYIVHQKNIGNLWLQPFEPSGAARPLTDFTSGNIYNFAFSPDGASLYIARGNQINDAILIKNFR